MKVLFMLIDMHSVNGSLMPNFTITGSMRSLEMICNTLPQRLESGHRNKTWLI